MYLGKGRPVDFRHDVRDTVYERPPQEGIPVDTALPHGAEISATGLMLPREIDAGQWKEIGAKLAGIHHGVQWAIGDWWAYGDHRYGERKAAAKLFPFALGSLMNFGRVARRVPPSRRNAALSYEHHVAVGALEAEDQEKMLARATEFGWTSGKLRDAIKDQKDRLEFPDCAPNDQIDGDDAEASSGHNSGSRDQFNWMALFLEDARRAEDMCPAVRKADLELLHNAGAAEIDQIVQAALRTADAWSEVASKIESLHGYQAKRAALPNPLPAKALEGSYAESMIARD